MATLTLAVGEPADREQVGTLEQPDAILKIEAAAGVELFGDVVEAGSRASGD